MGFLNSLLTRLGDLLLSPVAFRSPWPGLVWASLVASFVLVALFRWTSNPVRMRRCRDQLIARVLELLLFRHDLGVSLTACGRIAVANLRYLSVFLLPMAVSLVPLWLLFSQFAAWFDFRPLNVNEAVVVELELRPELAVMRTRVQVTASPSLQLLNAGVRVPAGNELCLRLRAIHPEPGEIELRIGTHIERRTILVSDRLARVAATSHRAGLWQALLHPADAPLAEDSPFIRMDVRYPPRQFLLGDREVPWVLAAFVFAMLFSLLLGKLLGIQIA